MEMECGLVCTAGMEPKALCKQASGLTVDLQLDICLNDELTGAVNVQ